jgi:hypothetical protein
LNTIWAPFPDCAPVTSALFQPGRILATAAALRAMQEASAKPCDYLWRHLTGSWGSVSNAGHHANDCAVREGGRILNSSITRNQNLAVFLCYRIFIPQTYLTLTETSFNAAD